ncbi:MAG: ATPase, T2SS/T4P/T4SS family [Patescibacteria group bacterium]
MAKDARTIEETSTGQRAQLLGLRYVDTRTFKSKPLYKELLTNEQMYALRAVPVTSNKDGITFGITTTTAPKVREQLRDSFNDHRVEYVLISDSSFNDYMLLYDPPKEVVYHDIELAQAASGIGIEEISKTLLEVKADDMLAYLVKQAFRLKASDIHLENEEDYTRVRFRVHGVLHPIAKLPGDKYRILVSAIASSASISTASNDAQTGHIGRKFVMEDGSEVMVNLRIETVPAIHGMDIVMRLFNFNPDMLHLDKLGLEPYQSEAIRGIVQNPSGLVMIVGPTGSGKSTTLYSIINELISPERKIITLEDPVEYQIPGITQIPIDSHSGASFGEGLRAVLRLDPDVVMVGEIRDDDTAKTALQAALTGHLVLSTYHASSAAAAMTRILDATNENPLFLSSIRLIQAQRLVRKLDPKTRVAYKPDQQTAEYIRRVLDTLPSYIDAPDLTDITLYKPGSSEERPFGFEGQVAVRELMLMTDDLISLVKSADHNLTAQDIESTAVQGGMLTLQQDGVLKAVQGITTLEEVARVIG